jgi:hypothetical protein
MSAEALVQQARAAGVTLRLENGKIKVRGKTSVVEKLTPTLRQHKAELLAWFKQDELPRVLPVEVLRTEYQIYTKLIPFPEPPPDPQAWRELAQAYHAHHFKCHTCQAAGRGAMYGKRCGTGAALWIEYSTTN